MKTDMWVWLTNGEIAWEIPEGRIAMFYVHGYYRSPDDWRVHEGRLPGEWQSGKCGEMRKDNHGVD